MNVKRTATVARTPSVKWSTKGNNAPVQLHSFQTQPQLLVASRSPNIAPLTASATRMRSVSVDLARYLQNLAIPTPTVLIISAATTKRSAPILATLPTTVFPATTAVSLITQQSAPAPMTGIATKMRSVSIRLARHLKCKINLVPRTRTAPMAKSVRLGNARINKIAPETMTARGKRLVCLENVPQ